jgi:hypothetical protein
MINTDEFQRAAKRRIAIGGGALVGSAFTLFAHSWFAKKHKDDPTFATVAAIGAGTTLMTLCASALYRHLLPDPPIDGELFLSQSKSS